MQLDVFTPQTEAAQLRLKLADKAESILHLFEAFVPGDPAPREAIATARRFARGEATTDELAAARKAVARSRDRLYRLDPCTCALVAARCAANAAGRTCCTDPSLAAVLIPYDVEHALDHVRQIEGVR